MVKESSHVIKGGSSRIKCGGDKAIVMVGCFPSIQVATHKIDRMTRSTKACIEHNLPLTKSNERASPSSSLGYPTTLPLLRHLEPPFLVSVMAS